MNTLERLHFRLHTLSVFRKLLEDPVISLLTGLLSAATESPVRRADAYATAVSLLYREGGNLTEHITRCMLEDENIYALRRAQKRPPEDALEQCVRRELEILQELSQLTSSRLLEALAFGERLPEWQTSSIDLAAAYFSRMDEIGKYGWGIYARHFMFILREGGVYPALCPDTVRLADLKDYEEERGQVVRNTLLLLQGKKAANALLYGDAGTGKSSTVKAVANEYAGEGLRLVEIPKRQYRHLPEVMEQLAQSPLKFILFIDDLSFSGDTDDFNALKAVLEGSVFASAANLAVYATSNRRHLVRETFSDRAGDDLHIGETIQEFHSLSERFPLSVGFFRPDKRRYLQIVRLLATQYGIRMDAAELERQAEAYAIARGGRSPRIARHFIEYLMSVM